VEGRDDTRRNESDRESAARQRHEPGAGGHDQDGWPDDDCHGGAAPGARSSHPGGLRRISLRTLENSTTDFLSGPAVRFIPRQVQPSEGGAVVRSPHPAAKRPGARRLRRTALGVPFSGHAPGVPPPPGAFCRRTSHGPRPGRRQTAPSSAGATRTHSTFEPPHTGSRALTMSVILSWHRPAAAKRPPPPIRQFRGPVGWRHHLQTPTGGRGPGRNRGREGSVGDGRKGPGPPQPPTDPIDDRQVQPAQLEAGARPA